MSTLIAGLQSPNLRKRMSLPAKNFHLYNLLNYFKIDPHLLRAYNNSIPDK